MSRTKHFLLVTPSFNQGQYIGETISSVVTQGVQLHYLVMDGGSTDQTVQVLEKFSNKISWFSKKDKGQTDAINKGIRYFKTVIKKEKLNKADCIFAYLNSDDVLTTNCLKLVNKYFKDKPDTQWLVGDALIVDQNNQEIQPLVRLYKKLGRSLLNWSLLLIVNPIPQPATFIRWSVIEKVGYFNDSLHFVMDYEYWLRIWKSFGKPATTASTLAMFRIHGQSKGGTLFKRQFAEQLAVARQFSNNQFILWLQKLHNAAIVFVYSQIKQ